MESTRRPTADSFLHTAAEEVWQSCTSARDRMSCRSIKVCNIHTTPPRHTKTSFCLHSKTKSRLVGHFLMYKDGIKAENVLFVWLLVILTGRCWTGEKRKKKVLEQLTWLLNVWNRILEFRPHLSWLALIEIFHLVLLRSISMKSSASPLFSVWRWYYLGSLQ